MHHALHVLDVPGCNVVIWGCHLWMTFMDVICGCHLWMSLVAVVCVCHLKLSYLYLLWTNGYETKQLKFFTGTH